MKIRIFALAKELGLDSKELITFAGKAGVQVKNSALASISPEERDRVVNFIKNGGPATTDAPELDVPPSPVGDDGPDAPRKVRHIAPTKLTRTPARVADHDEAARDDATEPSDVSVAATDEPAEEPAEKPAEQREPPETAPEAAVEPAAEIDVDVEPEAVSEEESTDVAAVDVAADESTEPLTDEPPVEAAPAQDESDDEAASDAAAEATPDGAPAPAMSPDEYVPPPTGSRDGGGSMRTLQQMKPVGTESARRGRQSRSASPAIAAVPQFNTPKKPAVKRDTETAQKPEIRLNADVLAGNSPLSKQMLRREEDKRTGATPGRKPARKSRGGVGVKDLTEQGRTSTRRRRPRRGDDYVDGSGRRPRRTKGRRGPIEYAESAVVETPMTVRSLSEDMGRPARSLLQILFRRGEMITINESVSEETALEIALELGVDIEFKRPRDVEQELAEELDAVDPEETLVERPPIVTILGHVDHGKTTLLDKLRSANVAAGESGGITQHIASHQVEHDGRLITFVDTPGHAAFGEMRARGANVTDIVVLVVAADDGVMPQTVECIAHARSADVPIVVALNKIDLPDVDEQRVLTGLTQHDILASEWGGDVEVVRTSGETGQGLDDLLETLLLTAELHEFKANPDRPAVGVCLEAFHSEGRGVIAWLVVQKGTLEVGDVVLCGGAYGRIRAMYNDRDEEIEFAGPSMPVRVTGLDVVPGAGDHFFVMDDLDVARETAEDRLHRDRAVVLSGRGRTRTMEDILAAARGGEVQDLPLIIKADTPGSLEAIKGEIDKFEHPEVRVEIVHQGVGGVNESDVALANASGAIIIAFHVVAEDRARDAAIHDGVEIRRYEVIYEVTDRIKLSLEGLLAPERVQVATGRALVLRTFSISRYGTIAGCRVLSGTIERSNRLHVIRDQTVINDYSIASLKREKDDVREVREGMECGIRLDGFNDIKEGDLLEAFRIDEVQRTLDS